MDDKKLRQNEIFLAALQELTTSLVDTFGKDPIISDSVMKAHANVMDLKNMSMAFPAVVQDYINKWKEATNGEFIWIKDAEHIIRHVENSNADFLKRFNLRYLLTDTATKDTHDAIWARLQLITRITTEFDDYLATGRLTSSRYAPSLKPLVNGPPLPPSWSSTPSGNFSGQQQQQQQQSGEIPKFDVKKMKEAITTNLPIAAQALKEVFSNNEDNPLKSIMQMMKDPSFVGEDMASNIAGLAMSHGEDPNVMDMTEDPGFEEVNERLTSLESDIKKIMKALKISQ